MDKYRPCPSIIAMFTSGSQHPLRSRHAVYLGDYVTVLFCENTDQTTIKCRCDAGCSYHLTLNLFVSSADKLYKIF